MPQSADAQGSDNRRARVISQDEHKFAALSLAVAVGAAYAVCAELAANSRLQVTVEPTYKGSARASFLHAAARFLYQARVVLDPGVDMDDWRDHTAGSIQHVEEVAACLQPAVSIDQQAQLTEAMNALASEAAELATHVSGPMHAVVTSVQACIGAAIDQLREADLVAPNGDPA